MEIQEQQPQFPVYPYNPGMSSESSLAFQLDVKSILNDIEHDIKGEVLVINDDGSAKWEVPEGVKSIIGFKGINRVMSVLRSRLTKVFVLSNLSQDYIENITIGIAKNVVDDIYYNWEEYEIKDDASASHIVRLVTDTVLATLTKAHDAKYLKFLSTVHQDIQHSNFQGGIMPQQQSKGFLNRFMGALKGQ